MELQQSLNDTKKEAAENERALDHWRTQHDGLKLEEIECVPSVCLSYLANSALSDDDDEINEMEQAEPSESTEAPEAPEATEKTDIAEANTDDGQEPNSPPVKEESAPAKRKARESTPSNELHIYSVEELSKFKKREMIADAELLDGAVQIIYLFP
jgi:structural maintenance of chromosome 4